MNGTVEDGRVYAVYGKEEYGMPMDDEEMDRMDMAHAKYNALLDKKRFLAPIGDNPQRILDLGCGTGIWCIDVADMFPSAQVVGVDIAPTQPEWVPANCAFELDDIEQPWTWKKNSFDFIFTRDLILAIRDFPKLIQQAYEHLKPGGYLELQSVTGVLRCDDGTLSPDSPFQKFSDSIYETTRIFGTPVDDPLRWRQWLEEAGFEDVTEIIHKLPCNPWPKDQRLKLVGAFEMENLLFGLSGMVTRLFSKALGWTPEQIQVFLVDVRREIKNRNVHAYWPYPVVYGRKPLHPKPRSPPPVPVSAPPPAPSASEIIAAASPEAEPTVEEPPAVTEPTADAQQPTVETVPEQPHAVNP
ncbi:hypothetical protein OQA88_6144 [Cercophora sp. LCS_1]